MKRDGYGRYVKDWKYWTLNIVGLIGAAFTALWMVVAVVGTIFVTYYYLRYGW